MNINPSKECKYRIKLAMKYLEDAKNALELNDYRRVIQSSQLCVENSAKAVISIFRIPSWSHNPAPELLDILKQVNKSLHNKIKLLAEMAKELAPEHGRSTYGEPTLGLTPWELYTRKDAEKAFKYALKSYSIAKELMEILLKSKK